tara:strand:- start:1350 stop:2018 length:669 start_codon:yes stop_codon:yes gene_type:complete
MLSLKQGLSLSTKKTLGGWSPTDETSLEAWYQYGVGITLNGSNVSQWADSSSENHDMIQSTAGEQPAYSGGVLTFDGSDDNLASNQINLTGACTIAIRGDFSSAAGDTIMGDDETSNAFIKIQSSTVLRVRVTAGLVDFTLASGTFGDDYLVITRDGSNSVNAFKNGVQISASQSRSGVIKIDNMGTNIGGTFFNGTLSEVVIFNSTSAALTSNINSRLSSL